MPRNVRARSAPSRARGGTAPALRWKRRARYSRTASSITRASRRSPRPARGPATARRASANAPRTIPVRKEHVLRSRPWRSRPRAGVSPVVPRRRDSPRRPRPARRVAGSTDSGSDSVSDSVSASGLGIGLGFGLGLGLGLGLGFGLGLGPRSGDAATDAASGAASRARPRRPTRTRARTSPRIRARPRPAPPNTTYAHTGRGARSSPPHRQRDERRLACCAPAASPSRRACARPERSASTADRRVQRGDSPTGSFAIVVAGADSAPTQPVPLGRELGAVAEGLEGARANAATSPKRSSGSLRERARSIHPRRAPSGRSSRETGDRGAPPRWRSSRAGP